MEYFLHSIAQKLKLYFLTEKIKSVNILIVYTGGIFMEVWMKISQTQQKILTVGKREFLEKGFKDASLRKISSLINGRPLLATDGCLEEIRSTRTASFLKNFLIDFIMYTSVESAV